MYILRVDDCGWKPDKSNDVNLEYFRAWRTALDPQNAPAYYGFIPTTVEQQEIAELNAMFKNTRERVAIHGHDHTRNEVVTLTQMHQALLRFRDCLGTPSYIPPFNDYADATEQNWIKAAHTASGAGGTFFGGFDEDPPGDQHHRRGDLPVLVHKHHGSQTTLHLPATRRLYGRAQELLPLIGYKPPGHVPRVVTLHATWDVHRFTELGQLMQKLRPYLIDTGEAYNWLARTTLTPEELTGPHHAAYSWICSKITRLDLAAMEFGARHSKLSSQLALRDCRVLAVDRDPSMPAKQQQLAEAAGVTVETRLWDGFTPWEGDAQFDVITACWAVQHNLGDGEIEDLAENLCDRLKPGGRLLCVTSREPQQTRVDRNRTDPQIIMDDRTFRERVVAGAEWELASRRLFRYEHRQTSYVWDADPAVANAACYELVKK